jgi:hypothetical protein
MIEEASRYNQGMLRAEAANTAANAYWLAPSKPSGAPGLNRPAAFTKGSTFHCVLPQCPVQAGKAPEAKPPQAPGSSAKPNYPPKQQMHTQPQNRSQNSSACFECGQPGDIRANCPKLKQGLRTAATRQDDDRDPVMDPMDNPDLLIEGEGEPHNEDQNDELIADEWEPEEAQYQFNDEEDLMDNNTITY